MCRGKKEIKQNYVQRSYIYWYNTFSPWGPLPSLVGTSLVWWSRLALPPPLPGSCREALPPKGSSSGNEWSYPPLCNTILHVKQIAFARIFLGFQDVCGSALYLTSTVLLLSWSKISNAVSIFLLISTRMGSFSLIPSSGMAAGAGWSPAPDIFKIVRYPRQRGGSKIRV